MTTATIDRRFTASLAAFALSSMATVATAEEAATDSLPAHVVEGEVGASNFDNLLARVAYRRVLASRLQLGLRAGGAWSREAYFAGYAAEEAVSASVAGQLFLPVMTHGPLLTQLRLEAGARQAFSLDDDLSPLAPGEEMTAVTVDVGLRANVRASDALVLGVGVRLPLSFQVAPEGNLDVIGSLLEGRVAYTLSDQLWLTAGVDVGGIFGSGGDAGKVLAEGTVGLRGQMGGGSNPDAPPAGAPASEASVTPYVHTGWRVTGQGEHVNHGPAVELGVLLFRHLKVAFASHSRPGPLNRKTFEVTPSEGQRYKGQETITLRSDGSFLGLLIAPIVDLPGTDLQLEAPVTVGQGAYGFYLTGEDRQTPDGRRVSEWENELQDGKDAGFGIGVDAGLRIGYLAKPWLRLVAGGHYTALFGYEAFVKETYSGPGVSFGVELGAFE